MYIGIDIGGTKIIGAARAHRGDEPIISDKIPSPGNAEDGFVKTCELIRKLADTKPIKAIGVSCSGPLDLKAGRLAEPRNLHWGNLAIVERLNKMFKVPVRLENDANAAALAEYHIGHGENVNNLLYVTLSTGIGTGLLIDGTIFHGAHDTEGGQVILKPTDGAWSTFESLAAGPAIKAHYGKEAYEITDPAAWNEIAELFAVGLMSLITTLSPERVILGGGVSTHFDQFGSALNQHLAALPHLYPLPEIVPAMYVETAGVLGALLLAEGDHKHSA
jgi:predicted NBD/HSP70 family sugar kinase